MQSDVCSWLHMISACAASLLGSVPMNRNNGVPIKAAIRRIESTLRPSLLPLLCLCDIWFLIIRFVKSSFIDFHPFEFEELFQNDLRKITAGFVLLLACYAAEF